MATRALSAELLRRSAWAYANAALAQLAEVRPGLASVVLPPTFGSTGSDMRQRIRQLAEAVAVDAPVLFVEAMNWLRVVYAARGLPDDFVAAGLQAVRAALQRELPAASWQHVEPHIEAAAFALSQPASVPESPIEQSGPRMDVARRFLLATLEERAEDALELVREQLAADIAIGDLQDQVLVPVLAEVGRMWMLAEAPVADEHLTSRTVERALDLMAARIPQPAADAPRVLAFAVGGNRHDLGLRMVEQRLQLAGFRVTNLGSDMPAGDLPWAMSDRRHDLLAISVTLLTQLNAAARVAEERRRELGGKPPILAGGAPFRIVPDLHRRIGVEAAAQDAGDAVEKALALVGR